MSLSSLSEARANSHGEVLNLSGKETPDVSLHPVPDTDRVNAIKVLLREAKEQKRKPALKLLVRVLLSHGTVLISVYYTGPIA
jgi:hypothetical protein